MRFRYLNLSRTHCSKVAVSGVDTQFVEIVRMSSNRTVDTLMSLRLEVLDRDLYRSVKLYVPPGARGIYGGQLVANAIEAAMQTVNLSLVTPHSVHSLFLKPGVSTQPVYYRVRRIRDGRSFATRTVTAQQNGEPLFFALVNFHCDESDRGGIQHAPAFPTVPPPEDGITLDGLVHEISRNNPSERFRNNLKVIMNEERVPMEIRYLPSADVTLARQEASVAQQGAAQHHADAFQAHDNPKRMARYCWMRSSIDFTQTPTAAMAIATEAETNPAVANRIPPTPSKLPSPQITLTDLTPERAHMLIACWCSDFFLAIAGLVPHGFPNPNVQMLLSLDHTIYFHNSHQRVSSKDPNRRVMGFPVDDWFLYEVVSPFAANNRALNVGRIFSRHTERLEMTIVQESLIRMKPTVVSHL